jgi:outer membrane protein insertion porin family
MKKNIFYFLFFINILYANNIVKFENLNYISKKYANNIISSSHSNISKEDINIAIKEFYKLGYFKDIWVDKKKKNKDTVYTFYFIENINIKSITLDGYFTKENKEEILSKIPLKQSYPYTKLYTKQTKSYINKYMQQQGYFDSLIKIDEKIQNHNIDIKIHTKKGKKIFITKIFIQGNNQISKNKLKDIMLLKEKDYLSFLPFFNDGVVNTQLVKFNNEKLKDFYLQKGFFDFKINYSNLIVDFDTYSATLYIDINEGDLYTIDDIDIQYISIDDISDDIKSKVQNTMSIKKGDIFNISNIRIDIPKIKTIFLNAGYVFVNIAPDVNKQKSKINLIYKIYTNAKASINDVIIEGNNKTKDYVIRRDIFLAPLDIYNHKDYLDSISALQRTGFFSDVSIERRKISDEEIDLIVKVKETGGTNLNLGGGHSSIDGFFINGSIQENNTLGSGIKNELKATISQGSTKYNYELYNPRIFNSIYNFTFNIYNTQNDSIDFNRTSIGTSISIGKKLSRFTTMSTGVGIDRSIVEDKEFKNINTYNKNSVFFNLSYNNTNNFMFPSSGFIHGLNLTYNGFGGDLDYTKIFVKSAFFKSLSAYNNKDIIFSWKLKGSYIIKNSDVPSYDRLFLGGISSIRGYKSASIYPRNANTKGGSKMFSSSVEISFPISNDTFRLSAFADFGMIGNDKIDTIKRASYGLALQVITPSLPIIFIFPTPLLQEDGDNISSFEFVLGNIF